MDSKENNVNVSNDNGENVKSSQESYCSIKKDRTKIRYVLLYFIFNICIFVNTLYK